MAKQEKLLKEIKSLSDSIREKNRALKSGIIEREKFLESTFKPVTEPLKQISQNLKKQTLPFEGDLLLPISKYEAESLQTGDKSFEDTEESDYLDETEGNEEEEEEEGDILEKSNNEDDESTPLSNLSRLGEDIPYKGQLGRSYLVKMLHSSQPNRKYHVFGARLDNNGVMIGDTNIDVDNQDNIIIGDKKYKGTKGLFELIFKNIPGKFTKRDLSIFKEILESTNAHKQGYEKTSHIHRNSSPKFRNIIFPLFSAKGRIKTPVKRRAMSSTELNVLPKRRRTAESATSGKGLMKSLYNTNIIYYNNINKLVERMKLIHEAMEAGHTGLENEWVALIDELRKRGVII